MRILLASLVLFLTGPLRAGATEKTLSAVVSYEDVDSSGAALRGALVGMEYEHGVGDTFLVRAAVGGGPLWGNTGTTWSGGAVLGLSYRFDILRYVPYLQAGFGLLAVDVGQGPTLEPIVEIGGGVDVLYSRTFTFGCFVRGNAFVGDARYLFFGPRLSWRWGFF